MVLLASALRRFAADDRGATAIEYALIAALISVVIIGGVMLLGSNLEAKYDDVASKIS